jgi:hypothetical protein
MKALAELKILTDDGKYDEALEFLDRVEAERELSLPELVSELRHVLYHIREPQFFKYLE